MKKLLLFIAFLVTAVSSYAGTTVTVDDKNVTVEPGSTVQVTQTQPAPAASTTVVTTTGAGQTLAIDESEIRLGKDDFEGEIIGIDQGNDRVTVRYIDRVEKKLRAAPDNIALLKPGDRVRVHMRHGDDLEAWKIVKVQ